MYEIGREEVKAIEKIIKSGKLFRYFENSECSIFEKNYAKYLSVKHAALASSGTASLTAALIMQYKSLGFIYPRTQVRMLSDQGNLSSLPMQSKHLKRICC